MKQHHLRVYKSSEKLDKEDQLAFKMAKMVSENVAVLPEVEEMVINRIIDNASVAIASLNRQPVANARSQAICFPKKEGATIFGLPSEQRFSPEWSAWANGTAVRELDFHDTYLAADYSHPGDNIPPLVAVAQTKNIPGSQLIRAIANAYEIQVNLVRSICLHKYKKDHIAHLGPSVAGGLGSLLDLDVDIIYQSINQALHVTFATRQSRKGEISSWKAYAPAFAGKMGIEAVDRCMRGEKAPSPIYEGEDSVIAYMLGGAKDSYEIFLPDKGEPRKSILETYTKEHSAEYQSQALIDLAFNMRKKIVDFEEIASILIHTSHHTHFVIGTGAGDPQKMDPNASRETLDHSIMYIFAVALQDGEWHHVRSYAPERACRKDTVTLWHKISTCEDQEWTKRYHEEDPSKKAFGARVEIKFKDGRVLVDELALANAHSAGARPFQRKEYIRKFHTLTEGLIEKNERDRFLEVVQDLKNLKGSDMGMLHVVAPQETLQNRIKDSRGIF